MKKSMHINESIPVTITQVKEKLKTAKKGGKDYGQSSQVYSILYQKKK